MNIDWHDLGTAFALYLILEGLLPFLSPARAQRLLLAMAQAPALQLRIAGLVSMLAGCALVYLIRSS
jgi:uncharacterized protein YjeT (DUF2065 family)